ncbi:hypothetical protein [Paraburkholderia dipogonis]|uniref:hypothetical protein n=1 Tax=Paraburkholderia dipogonis TaxID=1211383 RepID=UPI0038B962BB
MLAKCGECEKLISTEAQSCPGCGAPNRVQTEDDPQQGMSRGVKIALWVVGVPVAFLGFLAFIGSNLSPEEQERQRAGAAIDYCDKQTERKSLSPSEIRFIAAACEKLRGDYRAKYGHDY